MRAKRQKRVAKNVDASAAASSEEEVVVSSSLKSTDYSNLTKPEFSAISAVDPI